MVEEGRGLKFNIPHHFESNVKASGAFNNPSRTRRLAQEAVTLSTSLPLSYNSSVFVRCDEERLDIMKVCACESACLRVFVFTSMVLRGECIGGKYTENIVLCVI